MNYQKGFTLMELVVTIGIVALLSVIVLFSVSQYLNKGRDANVQGNLAVLVPSGEAYYNGEDAANGDGYTGFCSSSSVVNIYAQLSLPKVLTTADCHGGSNPGLCCNVVSGGSQWMACAQEFVNATRAFCVDSTGIKREICNTSCDSTRYACPSDNLSGCE